MRTPAVTGAARSLGVVAGRPASDPVPGGAGRRARRRGPAARRCEPRDGVDQPADRGGVAAGGAVAALVGGLDRDLDAGAALDDDPVGAGAARRLAASRGRTTGWMRVTCSMTIRGSPSTMPCTSNRSAPWVPASNAPMRVGDRRLQRPPLQRLADLVELDAQGPGDQPDLAAPDHRRHRRARPSAARSPSAGPCRPGSGPSRAGRRSSSRRSPGSGPASTVGAEPA